VSEAPTETEGAELDRVVVGAGLNDNQRKGAFLDASGVGIKGIMKELGVGKTTVSRWRRNPEYRRLRDECVEQLNEELEGYVKRSRVEAFETAIVAMRTLREIAGDPTASENARVMAARDGLQAWKIAHPQEGNTGTPQGASAVVVVQVDSVQPPRVFTQDEQPVLEGTATEG